MYGYGIGQISGNTFTGSTNFGYPFNVRIDDVSITGTVPILWNGAPVPTSVSCVKVW